MKKYKVVLLTQGFVAIIDAEDWKRVKRHSWHVHFSAGRHYVKGKPYARTTINKKKIYLHRFVTYCPPELEPDHKNHCTLDCRKENLALTTRSENLKNRRKYVRK